jgi:hypothetical protein
MLGHGYSRGNRTQTIAAASLVWRQANETAERILAGVASSDWMQVVYEDLCKRPDAVLRRVYDFIGIDSGHLVLDFRSRQQHILGNDMRLKSTSEIRLDERWRKTLSDADLAIFDKVAGRMNRKYGYE